MILLDVRPVICLLLFIFRLETHFLSGDILGINIDFPLLHWARNSLLFWGHITYR